MKKVQVLTAGAVVSLSLLVFVTGCKRRGGGISLLPGPTDYTTLLQPLVASAKLPELHWPNFSDYQPAVQQFYNDRQFDLAWTRDGKPTPQAIAFIDAMQHADVKGLNPEDYDAAQWSSRASQLNPKDDASLAKFDVEMTISVMRFISDLHVGRINPQHFGFDIHPEEKKYDLAKFLNEKAVSAGDVPQLIASVEPDSDLYRQTEQALTHYMELAKQQQQANADPLPVPDKPITVGHSYPQAAELWQRLQLEGDAPADGEAPASYNKALSDAVKAYQERHGITDDGRLTPQTVKSLNVPLTQRVVQLQDSLERLRWLPEPYLHPRLMVNLPEFLLRGYDEDHKLDFTMKVVVGKSTDNHQTPVFTHMMRYLVFRPYWNVPVDIAKKELVPHMLRTKGYLESKNYEVTNNKGKVLPSYTVHQVEHAMVLVREKPGPTNSLGLVKFMFPNQYDIYMHSTPEVSLFSRTRRDYSHGCIRVQKPDELAAWVLDGQKDWDIDSVRDAMNTGKDNHQVGLKKPLPVVIFYLTAMPEEDGHVHFFDDLYGYDAELQAALAKGMPYPKAPEPIKPKTKPGDTV